MQMPCTRKTAPYHFTGLTNPNFYAFIFFFKCYWATACSALLICRGEKNWNGALSNHGNSSAVRSILTSNDIPSPPDGIINAIWHIWPLMYEMETVRWDHEGNAGLLWGDSLAGTPCKPHGGRAVIQTHTALALLHGFRLFLDRRRLLNSQQRSPREH